MYSQHSEEEFILKACAKSERRRALDIGAWHPKTFSNSRALIESGWGALLIEPSPGPLRALVQEYGEWASRGNAPVQVLSAAVAVEPGVITINITDDAVSTSVGEQAVLWSTRGGYFGYLDVPTITIPQILDRYGAFDFVNIDAEGVSIPLLAELLKTELFPACICVEHDGRFVEAAQLAAARGYVQVYASEENLVFGR